MLCRGLQAWYDKRQGTGYTVEMPQLCALPPRSILAVPEAREAWWGEPESVWLDAGSANQIAAVP